MVFLYIEVIYGRQIKQQGCLTLHLLLLFSSCCLLRQMFSMRLQRKERETEGYKAEVRYSFLLELILFWFGLFALAGEGLHFSNIPSVKKHRQKGNKIIPDGRKPTLFSISLFILLGTIWFCFISNNTAITAAAWNYLKTLLCRLARWNSECERVMEKARECDCNPFKYTSISVAFGSVLGKVGSEMPHSYSWKLIFLSSLVLGDV